MQSIRVKDKEFVRSVSSRQISTAVRRIANAINQDFAGQSPLFVVILNGAFIFAADLLRRITIPCEISFVKYRSYSGTGSTGTIQELIGLREDIRGRKVIVVDDIVDTGVTMDYILQHLKEIQPAEVKLAALLFKPEAFTRSFQIDYLGLEIPNRFVVGYGLDYDGYGRNMKEIYSEIVKS